MKISTRADLLPAPSGNYTGRDARIGDTVTAIGIGGAVSLLVEQTTGTTDNDWLIGRLNGKAFGVKRAFVVEIAKGQVCDAMGTATSLLDLENAARGAVGRPLIGGAK